MFVVFVVTINNWFDVLWLLLVTTSCWFVIKMEIFFLQIDTYTYTQAVCRLTEERSVVKDAKQN